jgi:anti-sigma regulatory factor (Ser/Thr protein kinase)
MVLTSDGITEAHDPAGEMYGFSRLLGRVAAPVPDGDMVGAVVDDVERHVGPGEEQEDDITLVVVRRARSAEAAADVFDDVAEPVAVAFSLPSVDGEERLAIDRVAAALSGSPIEPSRLERLKTAVGETVMNAIEHGNRYHPELEVLVAVEVGHDQVVVRVTDHGGDRAVPEAEEPDIEAKLAGEQTPRGWGLFLIREMVDEVNTVVSDGMHTVELLMKLKGGA